MITRDQIIAAHNEIVSLIGVDNDSSIEEFLEERGVDPEEFWAALMDLTGMLLQEITAVIVMGGEHIGSEEHVVQLTKTGVMTGFFLALQLLAGVEG